MPPRFTDAQLKKWKREINPAPVIASRMEIHRENNEWVGLCPFHDEKTPSFKVYRNNERVWCFKCFGCGADGNIFQFIQKKDGVPFNRAVETVLELAGVSGWKDGEVQETTEMDDVEPARKEPTTHPSSAYSKAITALDRSVPAQQWLANRGIGMDVAHKLKLGFVQSCSDVTRSHPWMEDGWVLFPTFSEDGQTVVAVKYRSLVGKKEDIDGHQVSGILRMLNCATVLYNAWTVNSLEDVFIVEGEPDVAVMEQSGFATVGFPSAEYTPTDEDIAHLKQAKRRFIAGDNDKPGQKMAEALGQRMPEGTYIIRWPDGCKDANETLLKACGGNVEHFTVLVDALKTQALEHPLIPEAIVRDGADIKPRKLKWLWNGRVPMGKITIFAGNPDNGKSLATASLAAIITTGKPFPHEEQGRKPSDVLMMIGEDDLDDTAVPRLIAAGADMKRVHFLEAIRERSGKEIDIGLDENVAILEKQLKANPRIRLAVIDPISNYLGKVSMIAEQEARGVLVPLKRLAAKYNVAFVLVMHLNKKNDLEAISRVGGAMAFIGVSRCAWLFSRDVDVPEEGQEKKILDTFRMLRIKNNLITPDKSGLAYRTKVRPVDFGEEGSELIPYIEWGDVVVHSADDALNAGGSSSGIKRRGRPTGDGLSQKLQEAIVWLSNALQEGPRNANQLIDEARKGEGITEETLRNAKKALKVAHEKVKAAGKIVYMWQLPTLEATAETVAATGRDEEPTTSEIDIEEGNRE